MTNQQFGNLLNEGIRTVAARQAKQIGAVKEEVADMLDFSYSTVEYWCRGNVPGDPTCVEKLARYCVIHGSLDSQWTKSFLAQAKHPDRKKLYAELFANAKPYVLICYDRSAEVDLGVVLRVSQDLARSHFPVFFDNKTCIDARWGALIVEELSKSDIVIVFLSQTAVCGEIVLWELETIYDLAQKQVNRPRLLMVRLGYREPIPGPLEHLVAEAEWTYWRDENDTPRLIDELRQALSGQPLAADENTKQAFLAERQPVSLPPPQSLVNPARRQLEMAQGTMDPRSAFYVTRDSDAIAETAIEGEGVTITIKGARQIGKSSLLVRVAKAARQVGKQVVYVDLQLLRSSIGNADLFYRLFCALVTRGLGLADRIDAHWSAWLPNPLSCSNYFSDYVLTSIDRPLLVALDEVDTIFGADYRSDFFSMLRAWHNQRAIEPVWRQLSLALVTSTEPYFFIENLNESPFNVGEVLNLEDFSAEQCSGLNQRYGTPLSPHEEAQLMALLSGHPYLTQRALYLVASRRITASGLFASANDGGGPFGDHLRSLFLRLHANQELFSALHQVYRTHTCSDRQILFRLRGAGLIRELNQAVMPRCRLYADFFEGKLDG